MRAPKLNLRTLAGAASRSLEPLTLWIHERSRLGTILLFHRVSAESDVAYPPLKPHEFERHCEFYRKNFDVIPLGELMSRASDGKSLARLAAITFDDGYRDFLTTSYPILKKAGLPATHFLVEECVKTGKPTWNLRLRHLFKVREEREKIHREISRLTALQRGQWLDEKEKSVEICQHPAMLDPEDLLAVDKSLISWESHTASHALLPESPIEDLERELAGSKRAIEDWTNREVKFLSYPNGANDAPSRSAAKRAGYKNAFAVGQERLKPGADPFAIPRLDVGALPRAMLAAEVAGINSVLRGIF